MSYTLGELLFDVLSALGQMTTFKASGGSTTTAVNTNTGYVQTNLTGTLVVRETTDGAAPQNEFSQVTAFVPSSGTFTIDAVSAAIGSGDIFGYASPLYPLYQVIESINDGLRMIGDLPLVDTTTLDTASSQTEYTAAVAWKRKPPFRVDIQTKTGDANDNQWEEIRWWEYVPATAGSTGLIEFRQEYTASRDIRVWYQDKHPRVSTYDDVIAEAIDPEFAVAACALKAAEWQNRRTQGSEPGIADTYRRAKDEYDEMNKTKSIWMPPRKAKSLFAELANYSSRNHGDVGSVKQF